MDNIILSGCLFLLVAIFAIVAFAIVSSLVWLGGWMLVACVCLACVVIILAANWEASR